jgi:hypothetical protein
MQPKPNATNIGTRYRTLVIIWFAMLMSVCVLIALTFLIPRPPIDAENATLRYVLAILGIVPAFASITVKRLMLANAVRKKDPQLVVNAYVLAYALAETAAVFGLLTFFLTPGPNYSLFFVGALFFILVHFPLRKHLVATTFKPI